MSLLRDEEDYYFAVHKSGNGVRLKTKSSIHTVEGGAGSVSQMIPSHALQQPHDRKRFNRKKWSIEGIAFHGTWQPGKNYLTVKEYFDSKEVLEVGTDQLSLEDW